MKKPNWLYCFSNEKQAVDEKSMIGLFWFSADRIDIAPNLNVELEPEAFELFTFEEYLIYALNELGMLGRYCDSYFNVNKKDLTYAALKHDYRIMLLIDSKGKEKKVREISLELFQQCYNLTYPANDNEFQRLSIDYSMRKEELKEKMLKYNVLK